jgi:DNA-binding NarL/FixJ family response regulator
MLASGKTVSHIARELFLSVKTVNVHRQKILQKLHVKTTAELVRYAIEHKLLD